MAGEYSLNRLDLMNLVFDWNEDSETQDDGVTHKYSVNIRSWEGNRNTSGFCDLTLRRQGADTDNFSIVAKYYFTLRFEAKPSKEQQESTERAVAQTLIWGRFRDLAQVLLAQANIKDATLPPSPSGIKHRFLPPMQQISS